MISRLYLIRHGETAWSLSGQHTGRTDIPLTQRGEQDARMLTHYLGAVRFSRVFTSPLQRAQRTCELAGLRKAAEIEPNLSEWDYGDYEGQRTIDIHNRRTEWNVFQHGCPGGKSPDQIANRADRLIGKLRNLEGDVALFTHGHFGRALAARWIGLAVEQARHFVLGTGSISVLGYEHKLESDAAIILWNAKPNEFSQV